jgi:hypothetical protein
MASASNFKPYIYDVTEQRNLFPARNNVSVCKLFDEWLTPVPLREAYYEECAALGIANARTGPISNEAWVNALTAKYTDEQWAFLVKYQDWHTDEDRDKSLRAVVQGTEQWERIRNNPPRVSASCAHVFVPERGALKGFGSWVQERLYPNEARKFDNEDMERGRVLEPLARKKLQICLASREHQVAFNFKISDAEIETVGCAVHPVYNWLVASPDGIIKNVLEEYGKSLVEIKCPRRINKLSAIPRKYHVQMQQQMFCLGASRCAFYQYVNPVEDKLEWVYFNPTEWYQSLLPRINEKFLSFFIPTYCSPRVPLVTVLD